MTPTTEQAYVHAELEQIHGALQSAGLIIKQFFGIVYDKPLRFPPTSSPDQLKTIKADNPNDWAIELEAHYRTKRFASQLKNGDALFATKHDGKFTVWRLSFDLEGEAATRLLNAEEGRNNYSISMLSTTVMDTLVTTTPEGNTSAPKYAASKWCQSMFEAGCQQIFPIDCH